MTDIDTFARRLNSPVEVTEQVWQDEWSHKVADEWRNRVEVDTGAYRDSIRVTSDGASSNVEHSIYNEYGTAHMAPQPALVPAINSLIKPAARDLGNQVIRQLT